MKRKRIISLLLCTAMLGCVPNVIAEDNYATRGEVAEMHLEAAEDYNPSVQKNRYYKRI